MKKIVLFFTFITFFLVTKGAYFEKLPITFTQPDGTVINCFATGDEYHRRVHDANNYTLVIDSITGYLSYAKLQNEHLVSSGFRFGQINPMQKGFVKGIDIPENIVRAKFEHRIAQEPIRPSLANAGSKLKSTHQTNVFSTINNIVIHVRFSDETEFSQATIASHETMLNPVGGNTVSMRNYFNIASYNILDISSTMYPTSNGVVISYQDSHPRAYYQPQTSTNTIGYMGDSQYTSREQTLVANAINAAKNQIPSSLNVDTDNDGYVDNVCLIVRGNSDGWSDLLWPHKWSLYTQNVTINGSRVWTYNFQLEGSTNASVLIHEMFHSLGAPDLYRYSNTSINPVGSWDVMASNTTIPQSTSAHIKQKYTGWINNIPTISTSGTYTLNDIWSSTNNSYKILSPTSNAGEYFVIEYRNKASFFDQQIPGSGLVIYRINPTIDGNGDGPPDEVYVYRPNGTNSSNGSILSGFFSSQSGRSTFSNNSNPSAFLTNGSAGLDGIVISSISASGGATMSFTVSFPGAAAPTAVAADEITNASFNAKWTGVSGVQNYTLSVYRYDESNLVTKIYLFQDSVVGNVTNFNVGHLNRTLSEKWYYTVKAVVGGVASAESNEIEVTLLEFVPITCGYASNIMDDESKTYYTFTGANGSIAGHNNYGFSRFAEYYTSTEIKSISDMRLDFGIDSAHIVNSIGSSMMNVKVWNVQNDLPGTEIYTKTVDFRQVKRNGNVVQFDSTVVLPAQFFVGVEILYPSTPYYKFYLYTAENRYGSASDLNTACFYQNGNWIKYSDGLTNFRTSLTIYPYLCDLAPKASFTSSILTTYCDSVKVQFTGNNIGEATSWNWQFGDGTSSTEQNPTHTYKTVGAYSATLTVKNNFGQSIFVGNDVFTIIAPIDAEIAVTNDNTGQGLGSISLTASGGDGVYTYNWADNATINSATRNNLPAGEYTVTITDSRNCSKTIENIEVLGINTSLVETNVKYKLYPNPVQTTFVVNSNETLVISIYSVTGNLIKEQSTNPSETVSVAGMSAGVYMIKLRNSKGDTETQMLIVE